MLPELIVTGSGALFAYHHFVYPVLLDRLARRMAARSHTPAPTALLPRVTIVVPAYNEAGFIAAKVENLAALSYPAHLLSVVIAVDGATDATAALARQAIAASGAAARFLLVEHAQNRGKVAVLNAALEACDSDLVVLTDTSATMASDSLLRLAAHFADPSVGVVCASYALARPGSAGEEAYWKYQIRIKAAEAAVGAPMGAHGACYAFRRALAAPLEPDTINDDFVLPMRIVAAGYRAVYDGDIVAVEAETTAEGQDWRRRIRIGAGNLQQALRLWTLADPRHPGVAFVFLSGKALRSVMPFIMLIGFLALTLLAIEGSPMSQMLLAATLSLAVIGIASIVAGARQQPKVATWLGYLLQGHAAAFVGGSRYLLGREGRPWKRAAQAQPRTNYIPRSVEVSKRALDIVCGLGAFAAMAVLFVPIALAIKLTSRGPIFYRQQRVGRQTEDATHLFWLMKFRTMYVDAEQRSGAVWASKNDPRITPVGRFLRKTRLDELPQCFNVLKGEMSVIGPRPERPVFFSKLEAAIPFYTERTYGLRPGITGLAQVNQAYDASIEDVRNKVLYDHAYAARVTSWLEWLRTDLGIIASTVKVMALGKGQ
ncbi:MAG: sugar transferase [Hyphomicrobiaceae bacterium]